MARSAARVVAIVPYQRYRNSIARPVGAGINDAHGILAVPGQGIGDAEILQAARLIGLSFHASPPEAPTVANFEMGRKKSFLSDLTVDPQGYKHFLRSRNSTIDRQGQKSRRLIRELGQLRFEFDCRDPEMIRRFIELKQDQYHRTHTFDILSVP